MKVKQTIVSGILLFLTVAFGVCSVGCDSYAAETVVEEGAAVAGVPAKDTIKIVDSENYVTDTPERQFVWQVQTPQCFAYSLIHDAYKSVIQDEEEGWTIPKITDDAMVLEYATDHEVKMVEADYRNIKITTPEDLAIAMLFLTE